MGYYAAGDFGRGGGYYRGYYSAGGFFSAIGRGLGAIGGAIRSPLGSTLVSFIPGGKIAEGAGQLIGSLASGHSSSSAVEKGNPVSHPSTSSMPGPATQGLTSGGMMPSHAVTGPAGTPGATAALHGMTGGKPHRRAAADPVHFEAPKSWTGRS